MNKYNKLQLMCLSIQVIFLIIMIITREWWVGIGVVVPLPLIIWLGIKGDGLNIYRRENQ